MPSSPTLEEQRKNIILEVSIHFLMFNLLFLFLFLFYLIVKLCKALHLGFLFVCVGYVAMDFNNSKIFNVQFLIMYMQSHVKKLHHYITNRYIYMYLYMHLYINLFKYPYVHLYAHI